MSHRQSTIGVAIIGAGERGVYFIGARMAEAAADTDLRIVTVFDRIPARADLAARYLTGLYAAAGMPTEVEVAPTLDAAIAHPLVGLVIVTTHTDGHREPVERAVAAGRRVYLDKPIAVSIDDADAIAAAEIASGQPIMMGFTRRYERAWIEAAALAHGGRIGVPRMLLLRSILPYSRYLQLWHREQARSGGALNDKGAHHFDVLNWIAGDARPVRVTAIGGRSGIFAPDPDAPARCRDCPRDCPYRRHQTLVDRFEGIGRVPNASWVDTDEIRDRDDTCVYRPGADIDDHAVVTVQYDSGLVACLFFAIFGPWSEDQETLEIVGDSGRLRMERHSGEIDLVENHGHARSTIRFPDPDRASSHFGADRELVRRMQRFMQGDVPPVGVAEGVASLRLVDAALTSLHAGGQPVDLTQAGGRA
jgi:predicted dehydrogenase